MYEVLLDELVEALIDKFISKQKFYDGVFERL